MSAVASVWGSKASFQELLLLFLHVGFQGLNSVLTKRTSLTILERILRKQAGYFLVSFASSLLWPWPPAGRSTHHGGILALELHWVQSGFLQPLWRWAMPTCLLWKVGYTVMQTGPVQDFIKTSLWMDDYFTQATGLRVNRKDCCQTRNWVSQSQTGGWMFPALLPGLEQSWRNFKGNAFPNKNLSCYTINWDSEEWSR